MFVSKYTNLKIVQRRLAHGGSQTIGLKGEVLLSFAVVINDSASSMVRMEVEEAFVVVKFGVEV